MISQPAINRQSELRGDTALVSQFYQKSSTKIIICYKGKFLFDNNAIYYCSSDVIQALKNEVSLQVYLGEFEEQHYFVTQLKSLTESQQAMQLVDLRTAAFSSSPFDSSLLFYAQGLINWHFNHAYCPKCGSQSSIKQSGHSRVCQSEDCKKEHFPKIEPAVIFSIVSSFEQSTSAKFESEHHLVNKILLARQENWPEKRYSVLAGFAEHGESLELAVAREAYEEVGLIVDNIQYIASQPWPFPASLMLGFSCETKQHNIRLIDEELEHAQWLSANELKEAVESGELLMPYSVSISWQLVDLWYQKETGQSIKSIKRP
jgi:NAD+ diphosphatase